MTLQLQVLQLSQKKCKKVVLLSLLLTIMQPHHESTKRLVTLVTNVIDQTNIEVHCTEAISKRRFRITQGDTDTVQEKDIHAILPCLVLRRRVYKSEKEIDVDLV